MAYDDTKWGGFAKIIVDTSTMTVGDTVRVKSITTGTNYDKQVVTVGTPLIWETEIFKDYVKICMVQTINDTPTEIGGVYRTVDYGQTLFIDVLDKTTLGGIQGILNAHQEGSLLAIGDEVNIVVNGNSWTMQIAGINIYNSHEVIFVSKNIWDKSDKGNDYTSGNLRAKAQSFYSNIALNERQFIKEVTRKCFNYNSAIGTYNDYCYVFGLKEIGGTGNISEHIQMPLFVTQNNRIRTYNGTAEEWWTSDWSASGSSAKINANGTTNLTAGSSNVLGVVPAFTLLADS